MTRIVILILTVLSVSCARSSAPIQLIDLEGHSVDPFQKNGDRATVFLFTHTDCPISNRYAPEIRRLYEQFAPHKIAFWLVYVDPERSVEEIREHLREYAYPRGALRDPQHALVRMTAARVTPEAAVFSADGDLVYRGRIDDLYLDFGVKRAAHFFSDRRLVLIKGVPLQGLEAGQYQLEVEIEDRIRNEKIAVQEDFRVVSG